MDKMAYYITGWVVCSVLMFIFGLFVNKRSVRVFDILLALSGPIALLLVAVTAIGIGISEDGL